MRRVLSEGAREDTATQAWDIYTFIHYAAYSNRLNGGRCCSIFTEMLKHTCAVTVWSHNCTDYYMQTKMLMCSETVFSWENFLGACGGNMRPSDTADMWTAWKVAMTQTWPTHIPSSLKRKDNSSLRFHRLWMTWHDSMLLFTPVSSVTKSTMILKNQMSCWCSYVTRRISWTEQIEGRMAMKENKSQFPVKVDEIIILIVTDVEMLYVGTQG